MVEKNRLRIISSGQLNINTDAIFDFNDVLVNVKINIQFLQFCEKMFLFSFTLSLLAMNKLMLNKSQSRHE